MIIYIIITLILFLIFEVIAFDMALSIFKDNNFINKFFSSIWPGVILYGTIVAIIITVFYLWYGI